MTQEDAYDDKVHEQLQRKYNMLKDAVERFLKKQDGYKELRKILKDLSDIPKQNERHITTLPNKEASDEDHRSPAEHNRAVQVGQSS